MAKPKMIEGKFVFLTICIYLRRSTIIMNNSLLFTATPCKKSFTKSKVNESLWSKIDTLEARLITFHHFL